MTDNAFQSDNLADAASPIMQEIEREAQQRVNQILDDVRAGNTTIEGEILKRGG